jgi:hypothetical protein
MALLVMDLGALVLPITYGPVPVKSKRAVRLFLSMVSCNCRQVPSSINSRLTRVSISFN